MTLKNNHFLLSVLTIIFVLNISGCETIPTETKASLEYGSENVVALRYVNPNDMWSDDLSPPAEIIDMAINHCKQYLKGMKHLHSADDLGKIFNAIHTFQCTNDHADEKIEIELK